MMLRAMQQCKNSHCYKLALSSGLIPLAARSRRGTSGSFAQHCRSRGPVCPELMPSLTVGVGLIRSRYQLRFVGSTVLGSLFCDLPDPWGWFQAFFETFVSDVRHRRTPRYAQFQ